VGLAYPEMAAYGLVPVFDNIISQKKLASNSFSFYFDNKNGSTTSILVLGGVDGKFFTGPIVYFDVIKKYYWSLFASKILINGKPVKGVCEGGCIVVADTGTTLLTAPSEEFESLLGNSFVMI
jgi:cathepsin D